MSTKNTGLDDDNAKFDEFLQGKGELADLLRALPQEQPSSELDAKILADVRRSLQSSLIKTLPGNPVTQVADVGPAANQTNGAGGAVILPIRSEPARRSGFLTRWRVPLGICATLVLSLSVTFEVWQGQAHREMQATGGAQPLIIADAPKISEEVVVALGMPAEPAATAVESAPAPMMEMAATAPAAAKKSELAGANSIASTPPDAKTWLSQIEKLIQDDKRKEALDAWQKFRQVYPDYVVDKIIERQIESFRTQE
jgi:hypothetical protein